ncbi:MAG: hypothetical protein JKX85_07995, partial [Phycisphaeraceae bacterium]|nr:hypothetical protein [Phycisphaeraceae bacterium]
MSQIRDAYNPSRNFGAILGHGDEGKVQLQTGKKIHAALKRDPINYTNANGETVSINPINHYNDFIAHAVDILRAGKAFDDGFTTAKPTNLNPQLESAVENIRQYFNAMLDRADEVGLLPGKRTLEKVGKEFEEIQTELDGLIKEADGLRAAGITPDDDIANFAKSVLDNPQSGAHKFRIFDLDATDVKMIEDATGLKLEGYTYTVDSDDIRHAFKKHGDAKTEARHGQQALSINDLSLLRAILKNPDEIKLSKELSGPNKLPAIEFIKEANGKLFVIKEVRAGKKLLAFKTAYKKSSRPANAQGPSHNIQNGAGTNSSIGSATPQVRTIYTSIPEEWHNKTLFDWGSTGLMNEGKVKIGRRNTFSPLWLDQVKRIKRGENPAVIRELRKMTDEIWEVRKKTGKYWNTDHYLASPDAIAQAQARVNTRKLNRLDKQLNAAESRLEAKRGRLIEVQQFNANSKNYFTRRFLAEQVKNRPVEFASWLKRSWQRDRNLITDIETGKRVRIEPSERQIIDHLREQLDIPESVRTEGDLADSPELYERYQ